MWVWQVFNHSKTWFRFKNDMKLAALSEFNLGSSCCCCWGDTLSYFGRHQTREARSPCQMGSSVRGSDLTCCTFLQLQLNKLHCEDLTVHGCDDPLLHKDVFVCILTWRNVRYALLTAVNEHKQNCWGRCWAKTHHKGCSFFSGKK